MSAQAASWHFPTDEEMRQHRIAAFGAVEVERMDRVLRQLQDQVWAAFMNGAPCVVLTDGGRELSRLYPDGRSVIYAQ